MEKSTPNDLLQIGSGFRRCLSLWREIKGFCEGRAALDEGVIRDMSDSLEATLQSGENSVEQASHVLPRDQPAFEYGDDTSRKELSSVIAKQGRLIVDLENIKNQLSFYFQQQQASPRQRSARNTVRNPESLLDIHTMVTITDSVLDHINSTSAALTNLTRRIEAKETSRLGQNIPSPSGSSFKSSPSVQSPPSPQSSFTSRTQPSIHESPKLRTPERPAPPSGKDFTPNPPLPTRPPPPAYEPPRPQAPERPPPSVQMDRAPEPSLPTRKPAPPVFTKTYAQAAHETSAPINEPAPQPPLGLISNKPGIYCTGALRLQQNPNLTINDILFPDQLHTTSTTPVCKYCNLELDIYPWEMSSMAEHWQDCTEVASQHILMCASLVDRKAMFRCLGCERGVNRVDAEFRGARELGAHLRRHG